MFSIIKSGMSSAMHELSVISNNVSNANSNGFKKSLVAFSDFAGGLLPDAIENVISTINNIKKSNQNLITVIGCGGDRDKDKRPIMGKISTDLSSRVIFTSDNPRSEDPQSIIDDMVQGVSNFNNDKVLIEVERKKAIKQIANLRT